MDIGQLLFISITILWGICFSWIPFINWKAINYVKRKYPQEWNNELQGKIGTSIFGGKRVFEFFAKFNDPVIESYKNKWDAAFRRLLLSVLFSFFVVMAYIYSMTK
jgi:hypothetical protein